MCYIALPEGAALQIQRTQLTKSSLRFVSTALLLALASAGCAVADDGSAGPDEGAVGVTSEALSAPVAGARIVTRSPTARVLELVDARGRALATYYPGFFDAVQLVPDVAGNSEGQIAQSDRGTYFLAATMNPRTGVVAVAVRSFIYAEGSFDMLFLISTRAASFGVNPYARAGATLVPFDGRLADGRLLTRDQVTRPFFDIVGDGLSFDGSGRLVVRTADASGGRGTIVYNPNLSVASCTFVGGEGRRCPSPTGG